MMRPFSQILPETLANAGVLLFDIDDTLTTDGRLTADAYGALERAHAAGIITIPVTGRPAGWCDHIARMWPVDAVVGENGAFWFRHQHATRTLEKHFMQDARTRQENRQKLDRIARDILAVVPGAAMASDQHYREADIAIDFCEDVPRLPDAAIAEIHRIMTAHGLNAKVSSIHVNGWFGTHDKLTTARTMLADAFGIDLDAAPGKETIFFVGDSPNDQPMFAHFPNAVGVANVRDFAGQLTHPPAWVTESRCGQGFVEVVDALMELRR